MIHYGMQYEALLKIASQKLVSAKLGLEDATRDRDKASKQLEEASSRHQDASVVFEEVCNEFRALLVMRVFDAVEQYNKTEGNYPI